MDFIDDDVVNFAFRELNLFNCQQRPQVQNFKTQVKHYLLLLNPISLEWVPVKGSGMVFTCALNLRMSRGIVLNNVILKL